MSCCGGFSGAAIEPLAVRVILNRLATPRIEVLRQEWDKARIAEGDEQHRREAVLAQARKDVDVAIRRCLAVDREKRPQVAEEFDEMLEQAKTQLKRLEAQAQLPPSPLSLFTDALWNEALAISAELDTLWNADTTTARDKKELIRTLIKSIIMESLSGDQPRRGRIIWQDGTPDTHFELPTPKSV